MHAPNRFPYLSFVTARVIKMGTRSVANGPHYLLTVRHTIGAFP